MKKDWEKKRHGPPGPVAGEAAVGGPLASTLNRGRSGYHQHQQGCPPKQPPFTATSNHACKA